MIASSAAMIAVLAASFFAIVLNLAFESRFRMRMTRASLVIAMVIGIFSYGYGYGWCHGFHFTSLVKALLALCRMFTGFNDLAAIQEAPLFQYSIVIDLFWLGHFLAFYAMASATIAVLGERLLRRIRVILLRKGPLLVIYGMNPRAIAYGRRMARKNRSVVFVDPDGGAASESIAKAIGAIVEKDDDALEANSRFLKQMSMKPGSRCLELAALHNDGRKNLEYARKMQHAMVESSIAPEQASLLALGTGNQLAALQELNGSGYGSVYAFGSCELTARMIIRDHPPGDQIRFDASGRAAEDFHAVIIGFGHMGRAVLSGLVTNGQFAGSRFRADVFDPLAQNGFLHDHPMMQHYDIFFHPESGTDDAFYTFLGEHRNNIRMIVVCTGNDEKNRDIADDLAEWYSWRRKMPLTVYATGERYCWLDENRREVRSPHFFDSEGLDLEEMDDMAMQINQIYQEDAGSTLSAAENWANCPYFSRESCRASADFYPAVLRAAGKTEQQVLNGEWPPEGDVLETLSETEHMRWAAFHYAMGYSAMSPEVWEERAQRYAAEKAEGHTPKWRIGKDEQKRLQACLIPWEELDALSERENKVTGGHVDYKQMDRNNVLVLSRVLAARKKGGAVHG